MYVGDDYVTKQIFGLTDEQIELAANLADSLRPYILSMVTAMARKSEEFDEKSKKKKRVKPYNQVGNYLPVEEIRNGIIVTKDRRFIKILEVSPINFMLRSAKEPWSIIRYESTKAYPCALFA